MFYSREVVNEVVETSYKTYFMGPCYNWSKVPKEAKGIWWKAFSVIFIVIYNFFSLITIIAPWNLLSLIINPTFTNNLCFHAQSKAKFSWDPSMANMVKKGWKQKYSRRLLGVVCKMLTKKGYRAKRCHPSIKKRLTALRATDAFKKKSLPSVMSTERSPEKKCLSTTRDLNLLSKLGLNWFGVA